MNWRARAIHPARQEENSLARRRMSTQDVSEVTFNIQTISHQAREHMGRVQTRPRRGLTRLIPGNETLPHHPLDARGEFYG